MHFNGLLYRALNPIYAAEPLSGEGAKRYGGRFNSKGTAALYTSLSQETAIRECNQVGSLKPTILVCHDASIDRVFDTGNSSLLRKYSLSTDQLATDNWRDQMNTGKYSTKQIFAQQSIEKGYAGLLVRSYAVGTTERDRNLVLWCWTNDDSATLQVIDDENRLSYRLDEALKQ